MCFGDDLGFCSEVETTNRGVTCPDSDVHRHPLVTVGEQSMEVKSRSWETRKEVTFLVRVIDAGSSE